MNTYEMFKESSLFQEEQKEFDFELSPQQILSEISDYEYLHTQIFTPKQDNIDEAKSQNYNDSNQESINCEQIDNSNLFRCSSSDLSIHACKDYYSITSAVEVRQPIKCSIIENQLNEIFNSKNRSNTLANRKDVINKSILRGFRKYFVNLLSQNVLNGSNLYHGSLLESKVHHSEQAKQIGLMNLKPKDTPLIEFEEFICWLGFVKDTKKVRKMFSSENPAINLMEDVLCNYSHHKLHTALKNETIKVLFSYFIIHGEIQFMNNIGFIVTSNNSININLPNHTSKDMKCYEEAFNDIRDLLDL